MKNRRTVAISWLLLVAVATVVSALEIDRAELQGAMDADIEFENYEGPVDQIDSREAIRGIGRTLGRSMDERGRADYAARYRVRRIIGDSGDPLRAADIFELDASARVDHIVNLRRILAGYLETAWGYGAEDADLLARFITIYNAVHRGNIEFFAQRYRAPVVRFLEADRVGLGTSYRSWAGMTQIVIPIRPERVAGDLDAVDPAQLVDRAVIAELRSRADLGIEDRKAIIAFIERVIEERTEVIAEEREAIQVEQRQIDQRQDEIAAEIAAIDDTPDEEPGPPATEEPAADTAADTGTDAVQTPPEAQPPQPPQPADTPEEPADTQPTVAERDETPAADAEPIAAEAPAPAEERTNLETEQEQLQEREVQLDQRQEELDQEAAEVESLTQDVEELYQETAEDQAVAESGATVQELVPFVIAGPGGTYELSVVNLDTVEIVGEQTIPVATRDLISYQGGILAVHVGSSRMLLLEASALEMLAESNVRVVPGARVRIIGRRILTVIVEDGEHYIGEFDAQLVLQRRSADAVMSNTDIVNRGDRILVQRADGSLQRLSLEDFR